MRVWCITPDFLFKSVWHGVTKVRRDLPVAQCHECEEYEDTSNTGDQYDHHDDCVAVRLFDCRISFITHGFDENFFFVDSYIDNLTTLFLDDIIAEHQVSYKSRVGGCRKGKRKKKMWLAFLTIFRVFFLSKTETDI